MKKSKTQEKKTMIEEFSSDILKKTFTVQTTRAINNMVNLDEHGATIVNVTSVAAFLTGLFATFNGNFTIGVPLMIGSGAISATNNAVKRNYDAGCGELPPYKKITEVLEVAVRVGILPARIAAKVAVEAKKILGSEDTKKKATKFKKSTKELVKKADEVGIKGGVMEGQYVVEKFKTNRLEMDLKRIPANKERRKKIKEEKLKQLKLQEQILIQGD